VESKSRVLDMWRKNDMSKDNKLTQEKFIHGISDTSFPTEQWEIELVFDKIRRGLLISYDDFMDALKGRKRKPDKPKTESEEIHDIIGAEVGKCCCAHRKFTMSKVGEGKYRFGEQQKLRLVRILRSQVMVRVGGGWVTLVEFLEKNDPCRATGATNYELRETIIRPDHASEGMQAFRNKESPERQRRIPSKNNTNISSPLLTSDDSASFESCVTNHESPNYLENSTSSSVCSKELGTPTSVKRKKSDIGDRGSGKTVPHYRKETYVGKSSGYGVTYPVARKTSNLIGTPSKAHSSPKSVHEKGGVYPRFYGSSKSKKAQNSDHSIRRTSSITRVSSTDTRLTPPGVKPLKKSSASGSRELASCSTSNEETKVVSDKAVVAKESVFDRLASASTASRRASSLSGTSSKKSPSKNTNSKE
jgi:hypothetical protein